MDEGKCPRPKRRERRRRERERVREEREGEGIGWGGEKNAKATFPGERRDAHISVRQSQGKDYVELNVLNRKQARNNGVNYAESICSCKSRFEPSFKRWEI